MKTPNEIRDARMSRFAEACGRMGLKVTHQRMEIFRELVATDEHPDVAAIFRRVRKRMPTISLDTVYRNLKLLADRGLVSVVGMSQERVRFDGNMEPHHHFSCVKCGSIADFTAGEFEALRVPPEAKALGNPHSIHLEVKGLCTRCSQRKR